MECITLQPQSELYLDVEPLPKAGEQHYTTMQVCEGWYHQQYYITKQSL